MTAPVLSEPVLHYPQGPITPHGLYHIKAGILPQIVMKSYDNSIHWHLMGGRSIADRVNMPEQALLETLSGLISPWRHIDQKGATQDGVTHIDALYEPTEIEMKLMLKGRSAAYLRDTFDLLISSIDAIQQSELGFLTPNRGYWWAPVRWYKGAPADPMFGPQQRRQPLSLRLRGDDAFWRTYAVTQQVTAAQISAQGAWATLQNRGDQPMYWDAVCFGPGTFYFSDGPWNDPRPGMPTPGRVAIGPLTENQVALIRTDPRHRGVYDLTTVAPPQQSYNLFQQLLKAFLTTAAAGNLPPLLAAIGSAFGITPPQGPMYSLLQGRFSDAAAIPRSRPGQPLQNYNIRIGLEGGSSASKVIISGVPLRRYPL